MSTRDWPIEEGGFLVRGTQDVELAKSETAKHLLQDDDGYTEEEVASILSSARVEVGLYRWNPCGPNNCWDGGSHVGHMDKATSRGRGVFEGVYLDR